VTEIAMTEMAESEALRTRSEAAQRFAGRYLSVTTFKRDGTAVSTPVWFVQNAGRLLAVTDADSGKIKRIRNNPAVRVALCTASGRIRSRLVSGTATVLTDVTPVARMIARKYRLDLVVIRPLLALQAVLHPSRPKPRSVVLAITPDW
jgi:PPOX class probable F420-dependent enzyme